MQPTDLYYLMHMFTYEHSAHVQEVNQEKNYLILDSTIFYPQGGGQPADTGIIKNNSGQFVVQDVRFENGIVYHFGTFLQGSFDLSQQVSLIIDKERRIINSKYHTAGHLIDLGLQALNINLTPIKGYHFPQGAYVEYEGTLDPSLKDTLQQTLEQEVNKLIHDTLAIEIKLCSFEELQKISSYVPDYIPKDKPTRAMIVQGFPAIPCGGTHMQNTKDLGSMSITKIKTKSGNTRISYSV